MTRICELAAEHYDNSQVTMPVIGTMLTLRDKNLGLTMDSLARLDTGVLAKFEALVKLHATDLYENIRNHVSQKLLFGIDASEESSSRTNSLTGGALSLSKGSRHDSLGQPS